MAAPTVLPFSADAAATPTLGMPGTQIVNYIKRHWRGDLSLPVSHWVNGWLLGIGCMQIPTKSPADSEMMSPGDTR